jgi:glutaconate CoA-transferase subunit B
VITTLGVLRFGPDGEAYLASMHPGVQLEELRKNTGWALRVADDLPQTQPPTAAELNAMREMDPSGFWTK